MSTLTSTSTNTTTYARHIASKVAADLKRIQRLYEASCPSDKDIDDYQEEAALLLSRGYLHEVTYGFKRNDKWVMALKYRAVGRDLANAGDDPGGIRPTEDIEGSYFASFLKYSDDWMQLRDSEKRELEKELPFQRTDGSEPGIENGRWAEDRNYLSGSLGVQRSMINRC